MSNRTELFQQLLLVILPLALLSSVAAAQADPTTISVRCVDTPCLGVSGSLVVRTPGAAARTYPIANGTVRLELGGKEGSEFELDLDARGYWMPHLRISAGAGKSLEFPVWRSTQLSGRFRVEHTGETPKFFTIGIESPPGMTGTSLPRDVSIDCPIAADQSWRCRVPATTLDLTLRTKTFIPYYAWDVKLQPNAPRDLGTIVLRHGASFVAWLDSRTLKSLKEPARARLVRMTTANSPTLGERLNQTVGEGVFNRRGVLQVAPVPAGTYTLEVDSRGFASARLDQIDVYEGRESTLRMPITLSPPVRIGLTFEPPRDPTGAPWRVSLVRTNPLTFRGVNVADGIATNGMFEVAGQGHGHYTVRVRDRHNNSYASREFDVQSDADGQRTIAIGLLSLRGKVLSAGQPVAAQLLFGGHSGAERINVIADADGAFQVVLPHAGKWAVDVESASEGILAAVAVTITENQTKLEIKLPDTQLSGWVTGPDGNRVAGATVTVYTTAGSVSRRAEGDGRFRFRGVKPETVQINATDPRTSESSRFVAIPLADGSRRDDVELVLQETRTLKGTLLAQGQPVVGARITGYGFGSGPARQVRTVSILDGSFELSFPDAASQIALIVASAGRPLQAFATRHTVSSVTLDLAPLGGILRLEMPAGASRPGVTYNGIAIPMSELLDWARAQGSSSTAGPMIEIPNVAPGLYRFCVLRSGGDDCQNGTLAQGSVLVLGRH